jgi:hypothetical protein
MTYNGKPYGLKDHLDPMLKNYAGFLGLHAWPFQQMELK